MPMPIPIPRDDSHPAPLSRQARKQLDRIRERAAINDEAASLQYRAVARDVVAERQLAYGRECLTIDGAYRLAGRASVRAIEHDEAISGPVAEKPALELTVRGFSATAEAVSNSAIRRFGGVW